MLCAKCHENEATFHFNVIVNGQEDENLDLCKDCAFLTGLENLNLEQIQALSVVGKKCEFCGKGASSGQMVTGRAPIYWCFVCGLEISRIMAELIVSERPDLIQKGKENSLSLISGLDPETLAW